MHMALTKTHLHHHLKNVGQGHRGHQVYEVDTGVYSSDSHSGNVGYELNYFRFGVLF